MIKPERFGMRGVRRGAAVLFVVTLCLAKGAGAEYCLSPGCHARIAALETLHGPVSLEVAAHGGCTICHASAGRACTLEQGGQFRFVEEGPSLCGMCHDLSNAKRHPKVISGCGVCHDPHGSDGGPPFLRQGFRLGGRGDTVSRPTAPPGTDPGADRLTGSGSGPGKTAETAPGTEKNPGRDGGRPWGVRASPSEGFVRRYARRTLKGNLASFDGVVHRLMTDGDRERLHTFLEFQNNLETTGRPLFPSRRWTNEQTRIGYTVRMTGPRRISPDPGVDACYETGIRVDLSRQEDPELQGLDRELIGVFCRKKGGGWEPLASPGTPRAG